MKLLLDQNLSPRLVSRLADVFPDVTHVSALGLDRASDDDVWAYAATNGCIIVTKDADFSERSTLRGFPPKVIWLRLGNCTTNRIEQALRTHWQAITDLDDDTSLGIIALF